MSMERLVHRCIIPDGNLAGNDHTVIIGGLDIEYGTLCSVCEEPLASRREVLAAIYEHATKEAE